MPHFCTESSPSLPSQSFPLLPSHSPPPPTFLPRRHYESRVVLGFQRPQAADITLRSFASCIVLTRNPAHTRAIQTLLEPGRNGFPLSPSRNTATKVPWLKLPSWWPIARLAEGVFFFFFFYQHLYYRETYCSQSLFAHQDWSCGTGSRGR